MLTELSTVKQRLEIPESDVKDDAILTNAIAALTARFDQECNRTLARTEAMQDEFTGDETELRLACYPVEAISGFALKANEADGFIEQNSPEYVLRKKCVASLVNQLGTEKEILRVTYTGGYVLPADQDENGSVPDGQSALPSDIEQACVEQVVYWYKNRDRAGISNISGQGGSITKDLQSVVNPATLLPEVQAVLKKYERWMA